MSRMRRGLVFGVWVLVLFVVVFGVVVNVPLVGGSETIYIRADGSIDPPTAPITTVDNITYTFTDNIYDQVVVERNDTIIDGKGYSLQGSGVGLYLFSISNVTIKNTNIIGFSPAVALTNSYYCTLIENNITSSNGAGVDLGWNGGTYNAIIRNNIRNNYDGVILWSSNNSLYENNIINNYRYGIYLRYSSSNNLLRNNSMVGNSINFGVEGGFANDVDMSNTVDGKPIYYWVDRQNLKVPSDAGYVALVNSYNITVEGLELTNNEPGILLASTTNSSITKNKITNNYYYGIHLSGSFNNTISGNDISNSNGYGIGLMMSSHNTILANNITNNWSSGVYLDGSSFNTIYKNDIINNRDGVFLDSWWGAPSDNVISDNLIIINRDYGIEIYGTVWRESYELPSRNVIIRNNITSNTEAGVSLVWTTSNTISDNNINGNNGGIHLSGSSYNTVSGNNITFNAIGVNVAVLWADYYPYYRYPTYNNIFGNNITSNGYGVRFFGIQTASPENALFSNNITNNNLGVYSSDCFSLKIYHNNFINSTWDQAYSPSSNNCWDDGYPSGGNYWSDYTGQDLDADGIGDSPYVINEYEEDRYPLMNLWGSQLPVACFAHSECSVIDEVMTFDASASYDRDGFITNYKWEFGDGNVTSVTDPAITHVYTTVGTYPVNLTVTDNDGFKKNITKSVTVKLYRSSITLSVDPATVPVGSNVTVNGTITPVRAGVNVTISFKPSGGTWATLATVQTDSKSNYTYTWKTTYVSTYEIRANWAGDEDTWDAESEVKTVSVQGYTICIKADGSVDPSTAPVQRDGDLYTFTDDIYAPIVVQKSNIVIDGNGFTLQNAGYGDDSIGFGLSDVDNVTIQNTNIKGFGLGIYVDSSSNNTVSKNNIANNGWVGIYFGEGSNNSILNNNITDNESGISAYSSHTTITGNNITDNYYWGILIASAHNTISGNNIQKNGNGVWLSGGSNNTVSRNKITNNTYAGVWLYHTSYNIISENDITNNLWGVELESSFNNRIYHNNLINNTLQVDGYSINTWDDGYPSGGNYWSDYAGVDSFVGLYQNETGSDGIGDTPYIIDTDNQDHYPLINPWIPGYPIAYFTHTPRFPLVSETVTFNASDSYDYEGNIISYEWNFGDGNITIVAEPIIIHVYTAQGVYSVNLTVTNNEGFRRSITRSIAVGTDTTPPTTFDDYDGLWHTTDFTITLTATDDLSGVAEICYKINDGSTKTVSADGQPRITTEGANNKLEYWTVDYAGNEELPHKILTGIKLDKTYPTIETPSRTPDGDISPDQSVKVSVNVTDATSQVKNVTLYYTINDGETWTELPMNHTTSNLYEATIPPQQAGTTVRFKIVAYDHAGNNATQDGTEPYCIYQVISEFLSILTQLLLIITALTTTILLNKHKHI